MSHCEGSCGYSERDERGVGLIYHGSLISVGHPHNRVGVANIELWKDEGEFCHALRPRPFHG